MSSNETNREVESCGASSRARSYRSLRSGLPAALGVMSAIACSQAVTDSPSEGADALNSGEITLWADTVKPVRASDLDDVPVEVGLRFKIDKDGTVDGIRFYKGATNTGTLLPIPA